VDLGAVRERLSEVVYRGLGPDGEAHVLRIERAKTVPDLAKAAAACRDFLSRLGKKDLVAQVEAEIELLGGTPR
jgi:hypothetical protein